MRNLLLAVMFILTITTAMADLRVAVCPIKVYSFEYEGEPARYLEEALSDIDAQVVNSDIISDVISSLWLLHGEEETAEYAKKISAVVYADLLVAGRFAIIGEEWTWEITLLSGDDGSIVYQGYLISEDESAPDEFAGIVQKHLTERLDPPPTARAVDPKELAKYVSGHEHISELGSIEPEISIIPTAVGGDVNLALLYDRLNHASEKLLDIVRESGVASPVVMTLYVSNSRVYDVRVENGKSIAKINDWAYSLDFSGVGSSSFSIYVTVGFIK